MPLLTRTNASRWLLPALFSVLCALSARPTTAQTDTALPELPPLERADALIADGLASEAEALLVQTLDHERTHFAAFGRLARLAIAQRDAAGLAALIARHRDFLFGDPDQFQHRTRLFELGALRRIYNQAIQAAIARHWDEAEHGFSQLLGDEAFHRDAVGWLFHVAMRTKDFERARFLADLAGMTLPDPGASIDVLAACAAQRMDDRQVALGRIIRAIAIPGGYGPGADERVAAQRAVYLAMIRLHVQLDQCFLHAMTDVAQARPLFPDLPDGVLRYLARPGSKGAH
ncbi:MAG: hypothetical protein ACOYXR_12775 [Nitrospirota bacterium]